MSVVEYANAIHFFRSRATFLGPSFAIDPPERKNRTCNAILNGVRTIEPEHIDAICARSRKPSLAFCLNCLTSLTPTRLALEPSQGRPGIKRMEISAAAKCIERLSNSSNALRMWSGRRTC